MVSHCLPNQVKPLHPVSHGPPVLFVQLCHLMLWSHTLCFLPPYFFSRWFPSGNFFPYYHHPSLPQFSLMEILVFKVFSVPLLQTSLLRISLYHYLTSMPVPFPLISITWHFVCIFSCGFNQSPTQKSHVYAIIRFCLLSYNILESRDNTLFYFILTFVFIVVLRGTPCTYVIYCLCDCERS